MKKKTIGSNIGAEMYQKPFCKIRSVETGEQLCNASIGDIEPGGDMDESGSSLPFEEGKDNLWK